MLIQTSFIWIAYAAAIALLVVFSSIFIYIYQKPRDRAPSITTVCIVTISFLLATILLLPCDVALVSSTVNSKSGIRKEWATQERVDNILLALKVVYYTLYSADAILCLLVVPFTYFFYEEYDEIDTRDGSQTIGTRLATACKYTAIFLFLLVALFLVGFFLPAAKNNEDGRKDLGFFKDLLSENSTFIYLVKPIFNLTDFVAEGERALTFALGLLMTLGTMIYVIYTAGGLAMLPVALIKTAPSVSAPHLASITKSELEQNRERQRQLEARNEGREGGLSSRDRRELEELTCEEHALVRRERVAAESSGEGQNIFLRAWHRFEAALRPIKLLGGLFLALVAVFVWVSMLITGIDKAANSICKSHCGYVLVRLNLFQPMNWIFVVASKAFPVDYVLFLLLVMFFFASSFFGIACIGIRFLWISLFKIRKGQTSPQALLMATVMLTLMVLAINYSVAMVVAPQYATFGPQTYCDTFPDNLDATRQSWCLEHSSDIKPCSELAKTPAAREVCTPSVVSTFINRITVNFPFFGVIAFWGQFAFLGELFQQLFACLEN